MPVSCFPPYRFLCRFFAEDILIQSRVVNKPRTYSVKAIYLSYVRGWCFNFRHFGWTFDLEDVAGIEYHRETIELVQPAMDDMMVMDMEL